MNESSSRPALPSLTALRAAAALAVFGFAGLIMLLYGWLTHKARAFA